MRPRITEFITILLLGGLIGPALWAQESGPRARLLLGDPRFKDLTVDVEPGTIVSMETGGAVSFEGMIADLVTVPFVFVGESHAVLATHELQARVVRALFERDERLAIGLEMVPAARQEPLSRYGAGQLSEEDYLRQAGWYTAWGFNFGYYRPIFAFAREHRIPLHGLDVQREVVGRFQVRDGEVLRDERKAAASAANPREEANRLLLRATLESSEMSPALKGAVLDALFEDLFRAQVAREADMAAHAIRVRRLDGRKVVVVIGSGHILYHLGVDGRVRDLGGLPTRSVVAVRIPRGAPSVAVSRTLADYMVGVTEEARPAYPETGLGIKMSPDGSRPMIASLPIRGLAAGRDFKPGDVVVSVDGRCFSDIEELSMYLAGIPWGGEAVFRLLRSGVEKTVALTFEDRPPLQLK